MSLRDDILNARDLREETITIPEWGDTTILCRGMSAKQRGEMIERVSDRMWLTTDIVLQLALDPETRLPIFDPADRDSLSAKSGDVLDRIAQKIIELSGVDVEAKEEEIGADPT